MQHRRRVRRVADEDQIGVVRDQGGVEPEAVLLAQQHPLDRVPGIAQRGLRLGELRVHHDRAPRTAQRLGDQHEALGGTRGEQHLARTAAVPGRDGIGRFRPIGVRGQPVQRRGDRPGEPSGHRLPPHVYGEVDKPGSHLRVAVVVKVDRLGHPLSMPDGFARLTSAVPDGHEIFCHTFER
jgi:hypothetical protein